MQCFIGGIENNISISKGLPKAIYTRTANAIKCCRRYGRKEGKKRQRSCISMQMLVYVSSSNFIRCCCQGNKFINFHMKHFTASKIQWIISYRSLLILILFFFILSLCWLMNSLNYFQTHLHLHTEQCERNWTNGQQFVCAFFFSFMFELLCVSCGCFCVKWGEHCNGTKDVTTKRILCHFHRILSIDTRDQIQIIIIHGRAGASCVFIRMQVSGKHWRATTPDELVNCWIITIRFYSLILKLEFLFFPPHKCHIQSVESLNNWTFSSKLFDVRIELWPDAWVFFIHQVRAHTQANEMPSIIHLV